MDDRQTKPPPTPESIAIIDGTWPELRVPFVRAAFKRVQDLDVAEDLASETYASIRSGRRQWDRVKDPDFTKFAASVLMSNIANWRKDAFNRRLDRSFDVYDAGDDGDDKDVDQHRKPSLVSLAPNPEQVAIIRQEIEEAFAIAFDPNGIEYALLALFKQGIGDPLEQAKILNMSVDDVRKQIQRVDRIITNTLEKQRKTS